MYAAFLSPFLISTLARLEENPLDTIRDIALYQTEIMRNNTLGPYEPQPFKPPAKMVVVNILLFMSVVITLMAGFLSMLAKSWIRELGRGLKSIPVEERAKVREYRAQGVDRYTLPQIVAVLPFLVYAALVLFYCGLVILLLSIHPPTVTLENSHLVCLASEMATGVLDTVYKRPSTASTHPDVHHLLATTGGEPMHRAIVNMPSRLPKSFIRGTISLDQARTVATLIVHQKNQKIQYSDEIGGAVIPLFTSSSDRWDKILAVGVLRSSTVSP